MCKINKQNLQKSQIKIDSWMRDSFSSVDWDYNPTFNPQRPTPAPWTNCPARTVHFPSEVLSAVPRLWQPCRGVSLSTVVQPTVQLRAHSANCHLQPRGASRQAARAPGLNDQIKSALTSGRSDRARPRAWIQKNNKNKEIKKSPSDHPVWSMRPPVVILTVLPSSACPVGYF